MNLLPNFIFSKNYFGLSISQNALRAISINSDKAIHHMAEVPISPQIFDRGVVDHEAFVQALKTVVEQGKFSSSFVAVSLPEYHSFTRTHKLPQVDLSDVNEAISWQLDQIFPIPKDQIYFDWKLISKTETQIEVVIVAVEKNTLDDLVSAFEAANIKPISFEPAASALTRVVTLPPNQQALLIDVNPSGSSVSLIENNISSLAITSNYQIGQDPQVAKQNINITTQAIQSLTNFFQAKYTDQKPPTLQFILTGDSASDQLAKWFSTTLNHPVELLNIPSVEPKFHHAYAAAATTVSPPESGLSINLLPDRLESMFKAERARQSLKSKFQISLFLFSLALIISGISLGLTMVQLTQTSNQLQSVASSSSNLTYNSDLISSVNKASRTIVQLFPRKITQVEVIEQIREVTPDTVVIKSYIYDKKTNSISISGVALDRPTLIQYRQDLDDINVFTNVNLPFGSLEKPEDITFSINLPIKSS